MPPANIMIISSRLGTGVSPSHIPQTGHLSHCWPVMAGIEYANEADIEKGLLER